MSELTVKYKYASDKASLTPVAHDLHKHMNWKEGNRTPL